MITKLSSLVVALALLDGSALAAAADDLVLADFETDGYGPWQATGEAFGPGPAHGALPNQQPVPGFVGRGLVNSYFKGDATTGTLTSPEFKIERRFINFLIGGGNHPGETCINLLVDGKVVRSTTGADAEQLEWATWDVAALTGRTARVEIVDRHTGGWGHVNVDQIVQSAAAQQEPIRTEPLYDETYRPQFHFTARANWHNDPNGLVFYRGEYHLFFQHNPSGINWGNMTWGHAVSRDLIHWRQLDHALFPDRLGTMFSGSAVVDWDNTAGFQQGKEKALVAIYTAAGDTSPESKGQPFTQCVAFSNDRGRTWTKFPQNPVLPHILGGNRDPKVVWHAPSSRWIMALYKDATTFAFFASPDLKQWTHLHDIEVPGCGECPDFFEMPVAGEPRTRKWVWTAANGHYLVGDFDGRKFTPETGPHIEDWGKNYYAVQTYSDIPPNDGRRIQIAWMNGGRYPGMPFNQQMSFPCELTLHRLPEGLRLARWPVKEIERLWTARRSLPHRNLLPGENPLAGITGELLDLQAEIQLGDATEAGFTIRGEPVRYVRADKQLVCLGKTAPLDAPEGRLRLRILVDRTSLEVFAQDGKVSMSSCFVPKPREQNLECFARGGTARIIALDVRPLRSAVFPPSLEKP
jgi:sucrose-6-phosphate hydrolase SacC (GH32 family)